MLALCRGVVSEVGFLCMEHSVAFWADARNLHDDIAHIKEKKKKTHHTHTHTDSHWPQGMHTISKLMFSPVLLGAPRAIPLLQNINHRLTQLKAKL